MDIKTNKEKIEITKDRYYKQLGENLKRARITAEATQRDAANFLNVSPVTISRYESGDRSPDLSTMISLAVFYNTKLYDLLQGCNSGSIDDNCVSFHDDNTGSFWFLWPDNKHEKKRYNAKKRKLRKHNIEALELFSKYELEHAAIETLVKLNSYGYVPAEKTKIIDYNTNVAYTVKESDLIRLLDSTLDYFKFNLHSVLERSEVTLQPFEDDEKK